MGENPFEPTMDSRNYCSQEFTGGVSCRLAAYRCPPGDGLYPECIEFQTGDYQLIVYRCLLPVELSRRAVSS